MIGGALAWLGRRRPWPATLRGRLIALLLAALVASQAIGLYFFFDERRLAVRETLVGEALPRIANVVALLDEAPPELRRRVLTAATSPLVDFDISDASRIDGLTPAERAWRFRALVRQRLTRLLAERTGAGWEDRVDVTIVGEDARWRRWRPSREKDGDEDDDGWGDEDWGEDDEPSWRGWRPGPEDRFQERRIGPPRTLGVVATVRVDAEKWLIARVYFRRPPLQWAWPSIVSMSITAVAIIVIVSVTIGVGTRSLRDLAAAAERFGRGAGGEPVAERGPLEARRLIVAFNEMQERLTRFVADRTRLLASISHDLRTPITAMRIRAELIEDDETRRKLVEGLDELQRMAEAALAFAKEEATGSTARSIDLNALVDSVVEDFEDLGADVRRDPADGGAGARVIVDGRPDALKRALRNLVENAVRYADGARVSLATDGVSATVRISDDGPCVPPDRIEALFEPFARLETSRSRDTGGVGLGLSIARSIARAHGGDVRLANRPEGGLCATLQLPTAAGSTAGDAARRRR